MINFNHGHIQLKSLESTRGEYQKCKFLKQDNSLIQHVLETTSGEDTLDIVLTFNVHCLNT